MPTSVNKRGWVPKLRFPEFQAAGEWEEKKLGEFATFFKGKGLPKSVITPNGKTPCIHYGELFTEHPEVIRAVKSYTDLDENIFLSVENDVLMPTSDVTPSGLAKACCIKLNDVILGGDVLVIRTSKESINGEFLARYIRHLEQKVLQLVSGSTVFHLYATSIDKLVLSIPQKQEQQKIADCLDSLDELITLEAQKLDTLKTHKKGLMQQLFPAEGEILPKLRFPEFWEAGEWEEKALSQLGELVSGLTYSPDDVRDKGLLVLRSSNVQNGMIVLDDNVYVRADIKGANPSKPNDILICVRNGSKSLIGKNAVIPEGMPLCTHGAFMTVFRSATAKFITQLFQTDAYEKQVSADLGATINSINGNQLKKYKFFVPEPAEQQKIADCLASLDDLITAQTQKLTALKTHKKGLMQQLFPSADEVAG